jgi:hypothetical protein
MNALRSLGVEQQVALLFLILFGLLSLASIAGSVNTISPSARLSIAPPSARIERPKTSAIPPYAAPPINNRQSRNGLPDLRQQPPLKGQPDTKIDRCAPEVSDMAGRWLKRVGILPLRHHDAGPDLLATHTLDQPGLRLNPRIDKNGFRRHAHLRNNHPRQNGQNQTRDSHNNAIST